jgi:UTP--glucose-1-phosphate uridylyltransferase
VPFHGFRFSGERFDCGSKIGFIQANIAFAMSCDDLAEPLASWIKNRMALS